MKRVVVTGLGVVTPIGSTVPKFWENVKNGRIGFRNITYFDTSAYKVKIAAEVQDFDPLLSMTQKEAKRMAVFSQFAVAAAGEAISDAGLDLEREDCDRIGVCIGSGIGSIQDIEKEHQNLLEKGPKRIAPLLVPMMISNMAAGNVAIAYGLKGKCTNLVTACATGTNSIGDAYRYIQCNEVDVCVCGGTEAAISPLCIAGFQALKALSESEDIYRASLPFDKERSGFVMGEGAGVVVLESYDHAVERGARIYAEVAGYGCTADAYHITLPCEDGDGAARAMTAAMREAGIEPSAVQYINAHGTATTANDLFETRAIKKAFGSHAYHLKINSTKSLIGHLLGAAGAVEFVVMVKSMQERFIHATAGYKTPDEELDLDYTAEAAENMEIQYAMSNSLGFGGHNASLLIKHPNE